MSFTIIACIGKNRELGKDNDLVFHFKEDMRFFRESTSGHTVVMGYNTWLSIGSRALPNRKNIVISFNEVELPKGVEQIHNLNEYAEANRDSNEEIFVIGGGSIYKAFLPYANKLLLTEVDASVEGATVYFPEFDPTDFNKETIAQLKENNTQFSINKYTRRV